MRTSAILSVLACGQAAFGQAPDPALKFEVASVRPAAPVQGNLMFGTQGGPGTKDPERVTFTNVNLRLVLQNAYDILDDQISGPPWLESTRFDIDAKVPAGATREQFRVMLQNLLKERFQLAFHRDKKDFVVYELVPAKGGPKLKPAVPGAPDARSVIAPNGRGGRVDAQGFPIPPDHQTAQQPVNGVAQMAGNQITMAAFANFLKFPIGFTSGGPMLAPSRVVDKTGLTGEYTFTLEYEWPGPGGTSDPGDLTPVLFTALQQQLGLRLEQVKEPFDVLVFDRLEKTPTEN